MTLTKAMTENNTGLINNTAEIAESYNELGIADSKSTPGNRVNGESDYGSADAILLRNLCKVKQKRLVLKLNLIKLKM